jgi:hypothetical protein
VRSTGASVSGAEGEVLGVLEASAMVASVGVGIRAGAALWQAPTQLQKQLEPSPASPWPCAGCAP